MRAMVVDAYDSFIYIIDQYIRELGIETEVVRSGQRSSSELMASKPDFLILGPGPGHPRDSGHVEIVKDLDQDLPIMGVCLGHQAIGMAYGGEIGHAKRLMHGKTSRMAHDATGVLRDQPELFTATRYHSLILQDVVPDDLVVTARSQDDDTVMAVRHRTLPVEGVQFHPESIGTQDGSAIFAAFIETVRQRS